MVRDVQSIKPEPADLSEHAALVRDSLRQNPVKSADSVGRHKQQPVAEVVDVPDFSLPRCETRNCAGH